VDEAGLTDILSQKIDQGFTFPLNPKWVMCDANRWYDLYRKLLMSDKEETKQSMDIWFPPESGVREQIERVHAIRPEGFYAESPLGEGEGEAGSAHGSRGNLRSSRKSAPVSGRHEYIALALNLLHDKDDTHAGNAVDEVLADDSIQSVVVQRKSKKVKKAVGKVGKKLMGKLLSKDSSSGRHHATSSVNTPSRDDMDSSNNTRKSKSFKSSQQDNSETRSSINTRRSKKGSFKSLQQDSSETSSPRRKRRLFAAGNVTSSTSSNTNKRLAFDLEMELKEKATKLRQDRLAPAKP